MSIPDADRIPSRTRWGVVVMLMGFPLLGHFNRLAISVVGSERLIGPDGLTAEQMGMVYTTFLLVYTLCMLPGGWLIDRVGPAAALRWMGIGFGACAMLTGALGWLGLPLASLWICLIIVRAIAGAASAPLHPAIACGVARWTAPESRATANGLVTAAALVGVSITYPGFGWLMDRVDWPAALAIGGAALFGFALLWRLAAPRDTARSPEDRSVDLESPVLPAGAQRYPGTGPRQLLGNRSLLLLTASYAALGYLQYVFFYWVGYYFESVLGRPTSDSRWASFVITMSMAVGMAVGGRFADAVCLRCGDRWGRRFVTFVSMGLCALFAFLGVQSPDPSHVTLLFSISLGALGMCEGVFWTTATDLGGNYGGLTAALLNTGGNSVGALAPTITPWLAKHFGWETAIGIACVICALGGSLWLGIDPSTGGTCADAPELSPQARSECAGNGIA